MSTAILATCGGFLLAVLWMDLMFDVQVLPHRRAAEVPDAVLASIAAYYRRVTRDASPMGHLVGAVMAIAVVVLGVRIATGPGSPWPELVSLVLCGVPSALAFRRVLPNARALAIRVDSPARQSALARSICRDHLLCLAGIVAFVALQVVTAVR